MAKKDEPVGLCLTATKAEIMSHLIACAEVTEAKPPMPALACVVIESTPAGVSLRATNIQQAIGRALAVKATRPGAIAVHARDLLGFVAVLGTGPIELTSTARGLVISQGTRRYTLPLFDATEVPARAHVEPQGIEVGAAALTALLAKTAPAMGLDSTRETQFGAHLTIGGGTMRVETTNSHTLAIASLSCEGGVIDVIIPSPAAKHLLKILEGVDGVRIAHLGNVLHFFAPGLSYSTAIMSDRFAPVSHAIPKRSGTVMHVDRKALAIAAKSMAACSGTGKVRLTPSLGGVTLSAEGEQKSGEEEVAAESSLRSFSSSAAYFSAGVGFHSADRIEVWCDFSETRKLDGCCGGVLFAAEGSEDVFVTMPIRYDAIDLAADPG